MRTNISMKCISCKRSAEIKILYPFCKDCFIKHYLRRVERVIKRFGLIEKNDRILVAVSGGKDSLACAQSLYLLGCKFSVLYVDVNLPKCSTEKARNLVERFCKERDIPLYYESFKEFFSIENIEDFFKFSGRDLCATCGMLKRRIFNMFARKHGFNKIATGHCADDVARYFFKTIISSDEKMFAWLSKIKPIMHSHHEKIVTRIKPIFEMLEKENEAFIKFQNIENFEKEKCSYTKSKDRIEDILREIDKTIPDFKIKIARYVESMEIKKTEKEKDILECKRCGEISTSDICSFCRILEKIEKNIKNKK